MNLAKKACTGQIKLKIHDYSRHNYDSNIVPAKKDYSYEEYFKELSISIQNLQN